MKTLKRSLAMVLALVMVLGVMSISAGAAFEDGDKIQYNEAVDVLVGLKAIEGFPDGTFRADANVTRAQACKLIAYAMLGDKAASKLTCQEDPFTDVKANNWAAPYIAYCVSKGIVQGYGDGTFGPDKNVTGIQLATMLLRVLGRGQMNEYTGKYWDVNAVADANKLDLFAGSKAIDFSAAATREETALYIFNALPAEMVTYSKLLEDYVATETTLMATLGLVKVDGADVTDAYGYLGHYWTKNNVAITGVFADEVAAVTYVGGQMVPSNTKVETSVEYWVNGVQKTSVDGTDVQGFVVPYGATVSLLTNAKGNVAKVVATVEYAAVVTEVYPATAVAKRKVDIKVFDSSENGYEVKGYETESFAKGDVLVVMPVGDNSAAKNFISIAAAEKVTGTYTTLNRGVMTVSGTNYNVNANSETVAADFKLGSTADFYLDTAGNIIYIDNVKTQEVALNYVYVDATASQGADPGNLLAPSSAAIAKASIINMDGSVAVVDVSTFTAADGKTYYTGTTTEVGSNNVPSAAKNFYSYTVDGNGAYIFTALDANKAVAGQNITVEKGKASIGPASVFANSKTNLTVINKDVTTKVTGIANFPAQAVTYTANDTVKTLYLVTNSVVTDIYVITGSNAPAITTASTYAYYLGEGKLDLVNGVAVQFYNFYVGGKLESYSVANVATLDATQPSYTITLTNGVATVAEATLETAAKVIAVDETFFVLEGGTIVYYNTQVGCPVYNVAPFVGTGAEDTIEIGDTVQYFKGAAGAEVVYIVG